MNKLRHLGILRHPGVFLAAVVLSSALVLSLIPHRVSAQPEVEPWGNMMGIRIDGQLMAFESSLRLINTNWTSVAYTALEHQRPRYSREGNRQIVMTRIDSTAFTEQVEDLGPGLAKVLVSYGAHADNRDAFFSILLPGEDYADATLQLAENSFTIHVSGDIDRDNIHLALDASKTGRVFEGFGGNFRLQNPVADPQVIQYCLDNMRVAWGRVELPWRSWQPRLEGRPIDSAEAGKLDSAVQKAMEMAQTLGKKGIPFILSCWFPPAWAAQGPLHYRPGPDHIWGNALNKDNMQAIYQSLTDYIIYLKKHYGAEPRLFSFNESDLGINVRVTPEEHDALIKGLGAYFAAHGLKTKMLLGDNSDANSYSFIYPAMNDSAARPYIGAISFHSWRGWEKATLEKWADAATKLQVPLLVGEGSIDAAAWNYPAIFQEQIYAISEIDLYIRLLSICQPGSILQWQLTSDYSPLAGGGIFGDKDTLHPTWRFWNLKQLASTPKGLFAMPLTCDRPNISCAALGDNKKGIYAFHLVNSGAAREVTLTGLPKKCRSLRIFTTNKEKAIKEGARIPVEQGEARFTIDAVSYVTLVSQ